MITAIEIQNLRGIRSGKLEELAPFTILTGPNACGKSTVLDALLIGTSPNHGDAVGKAVERHPQAIGGASRLFRDPQVSAELMVEDTKGDRWNTHLSWADECSPTLRGDLKNQDGVPPFSTISYKRPSLLAPVTLEIAFDVENRYSVSRDLKLTEPVSAVRLVDPGLPVQLQHSFSMVSQNGQREVVEDLLRELVLPCPLAR